MNTHLIMCSSPLNKRLPDDAYQVEYDAAKEFTTVHLLDTDRLGTFNLPPGNATLIYHGWMMTPHQYEVFNERCQSFGYDPITTPEQYVACHHFNEWYHALEGFTPKSTIVLIDSIRSMTLSVMKFMKENDCAVIIKDYVKSIKHYWHEACFIPRDADAVHVAKVISTFMQMKNEAGDLQGNLVVRKFVELQHIGNHNKSGMPLTKEFRSFVYDCKIIHTSRYWDQGNYDSITPPPEFLDLIAKKVFAATNSNFFTFDVAQLKDNTWTCIEVGDGQVSAIPEQEDKKEFFKKLLGK